MFIRNLKIQRIVLLVFLLVVTCFASDLLAQCPMCRMSAESNLANGGNMAKGLNKGILYLFALPYLLIGTFAFLWWRKQKEHN